MRVSCDLRGHVTFCNADESPAAILLLRCTSAVLPAVGSLRSSVDCGVNDVTWSTLGGIFDDEIPKFEQMNICGSLCTVTLPKDF
jgi:hypothetical protein